MLLVGWNGWIGVWINSMRANQLMWKDGVRRKAKEVHAVHDPVLPPVVAHDPD